MAAKTPGAKLPILTGLLRLVVELLEVVVVLLVDVTTLEPAVEPAVAVVVTVAMGIKPKAVPNSSSS